MTTDSENPRLGHGVDGDEVDQHEVYLVLSEEEIAKGYTRPFRDRYEHSADLGGCGTVTTMGYLLSATYARDPHFYGATYCVKCRKHLRVGERGEFRWIERDGSVGPRVGT